MDGSRADGAGNALTSNSTTYTAKKALDANMLGTLGTAFSTAGKIDVKGADGDVFVRQATAANLNMTATQGGTWTSVLNVATSGGSTPYHIVVSSGTNGTNVKASAGQVYDGFISNSGSTAVYFRLYDSSSSPTVGTTTIKRTIQVPGSSTVAFSWPNGLKFTSGISWGITGAVADADTTAIASSVSVDFGYN